MAAASVDERGPSTVQLYDDEKLSNDDETEVSAADRQRFKPSEVQQQEQKLTDGQQKCKASVSLLGKSLHYPPPVPPNNRKSKIFRSEDYILVDTHALSVPDDLFHQSTETLMQYLCPSPLSELARLRSIYRWMTSFRLEDFLKNQFSDGLGEALPPQTPLELFKKISSQTTNYAAVFTQFARSVGLRCLTIPGITKSSAYSVGDRIDRKRMQGHWNAVHVNGHWRFIDVYWTSTAATSTSDDPADPSSHHPWTRLQLKDKDIVSSAVDDKIMENEHPGQQQHQQEERKVFNEFFFLPDPDQFVLTHLPDEDPWQLVDRSRIWTQEKFENYLYIRERFFELDMRLLANSKTTCTIETIEGKTVVVFGLPPKRSKSFRFTYMLFRHKSDYDPAVHSLLFERYVHFRKTKNRIELDISFPVTGRFLLNIYGKEIESKKDFNHLCSYVIDCKSPVANAEPLPDCPDIGWGPGTELEEVGVIPKSHTRPVVRTKNGELEMEFEASDLKVALLHVLSDEVDEWHGSRHGVLLMKQQQQHKKKKTLYIKLQLPKPGTYAVKLYATNLIAEGDIPNVLNYLVKYLPTVNSLSSFSEPSASEPSTPAPSASSKPFPLIHEGIVGQQYLSTVLSVSMDAASDLQRIVKTADGKLDVRLTSEMDRGAQFLYHLNGSDLSEVDLVDSCSFSAFSDRETKLSLSLPQSGLYALNIFVRLSRRDDSIHVVHTQLIQSTQKAASFPVQGKQSNDDDEDDENSGGGGTAAARHHRRRLLLTTWCSSLVNVWRNGLRVTQTINVYQTPVVFATAISDRFHIKIPPGDHPLVAELQKETSILFPQSHRISKDLRKDYELFSFQVSQNGVYRIDFYECLTSGELIHLATYSITRRNPNAEEPKELEGTTEPYEDISATIQKHDSTEPALVAVDAVVDDKKQRTTPPLAQKQLSKDTMTRNSEARKSVERLKPQKPTKKKSIEKKETKFLPDILQANSTPIETRILVASQLQNIEIESEAEPKGWMIQLEQPQETQVKVEEIERDVKESPPPIIVEEHKGETSLEEPSNPPPIIVEEYKSETSLQEDSYTPVLQDIITEPVTQSGNLTVQSEEKVAIVLPAPVHVPFKEKAMKLIPTPFRKRDKQTDKDLKSAKAKQKLSAQKLDEERKLLESSLRAKLEEAMKGTDAESIQQVLNEIKSKEVTLSGNITTQAAKRIECLLMADKLRNAVKARDLVLLRQLVAVTKKKKLESGIEDEMKTAEDVITRLEMIRRLTQMIVDMDRQLVAEVKSYLSPRPPVYNVIAATFMLLGEPQANIKDWKSVQHLFIKSGSDSLKQRVNSFDLANIDISVAIAAGNLFRTYKRHEVEHISTGIAIFYDWNVHVVEEVKSLHVQSGGDLHQVRGYHEQHPSDEHQQQQSASGGQRRLSPASHRVPFLIKSDDHRQSTLAPTQDHQQKRRPSASSSASQHRQTAAEQQKQPTDHRRLSASSAAADRGSQSKRGRSLSPSPADGQKTMKSTPEHNNVDRHQVSPASVPSTKEAPNKRPPSSSAASNDRSPFHLSPPQHHKQQQGRRKSSDSRRSSASSAASNDRSPLHSLSPPPPASPQQGRRKSSGSRRPSTSSTSPSHKAVKKVK